MICVYSHQYTPICGSDDILLGTQHYNIELAYNVNIGKVH